MSQDFLESNLQRETFVLNILKENFEHVLKLKRAVRVIQSVMRLRRLRRKALIKRMAKHIPKIVKIQAILKGHLVRMRFAMAIRKVKTEAPKKTKKYKVAAKIQAHVKGFLFRKRRLRALEKLNGKTLDSVLEGDEEEFDADKFFGIK